MIQNGGTVMRMFMTYSAGMTKQDVIHVCDGKDNKLIVDFSIPGKELSPEKAREIAAILNCAANAADPPKRTDTGLFATIRDESKYRGQQERDKHGRPIPFPVDIKLESLDGYFVKGGPGGRYTLYDVHLWTKFDGELHTLPLHGSPFPVKYSQMYGRRCKSVT